MLVANRNAGRADRMNQTMNIIEADFRIEAPLTLQENEVQLWRADLEGSGADEAHWRKLLSPDELKRASRFHFVGDRQRFVKSRGMLRTILASYLSADPSRLSFSYSEKEKPSLGPPHRERRITFNLSHSGGVALFAFARSRDVGIDVEQVRRDFDAEAIARRFFSAQEQQQLAALPADEKFEAFFRCWTRKEAYIKATGDGLSLPLRQFDVSIAAGDKDALLSTRPDGSEASQWRLCEVSAGLGYVAALCARGREWQIKEWSASPIT